MALEHVLLLGWALLVGIDLVSVPQIMIARPLVAGTVAGAIVGDPAGGALVGAILELFALDVLPVGAVRYPDYGVGAVVAAATVAHAPGSLGVGVAVAVGLAVAWLGEWSILVLRRRTSADVRRHRDALDAGEPATIRAVHLRGLARDALRAVAVGGVGLLLAFTVRQWPPVTLRGAVLLTVVVVGTGLGVGAAAAVGLAGRARGVGWFAAGLAAGTAWMVIAA